MTLDEFESPLFRNKSNYAHGLIDFLIHECHKTVSPYPNLYKIFKKNLSSFSKATIVLEM